jgi:hypothetical protein
MQWHHFVQLDNTLAAIKGRMGAFDATIQGGGLVVQTRDAKIEVAVTWAVDADDLVEHDEPHFEKRVGLGLRDSQ